MRVDIGEDIPVADIEEEGESLVLANSTGREGRDGSATAKSGTSLECMRRSEQRVALSKEKKGNSLSTPSLSLSLYLSPSQRLSPLLPLAHFLSPLLSI